MSFSGHQELLEWATGLHVTRDPGLQLLHAAVFHGMLAGIARAVRRLGSLGEGIRG